MLIFLVAVAASWVWLVLRAVFTRDEDGNA